MSADSSDSTNPIIRIIKNNIPVIIVAVVVIIGVAAVVFFQNSEDKPSPATPSISSSADLESNGTPTQSSPATSAEAPEPDPKSTLGAIAGPAPGEPRPPSPSPEPVPSNQREVLGDAQQAPELAEWRPVAEGFAAAWTNPQGGKEAWLKRMEPFLTKSMAQSFSYTQMQNVYTDTLKGVFIKDEDRSYVVFTADYEKGGALLQATLQMQAGGEWLVSSVSPPEK